MRAYLYLNAFIYAAFAVWCTMAPVSTAANLGYKELSRGGHSEYLVVYGGLQLGLAILFGLLARDPALWRLGMFIAIGIYTPIVLYRAVTVLKWMPVPPLTLATAGLESAMLVAAAVLIWKR